jgi:hypothetical protein
MGRGALSRESSLPRASWRRATTGASSATGAAPTDSARRLEAESDPARWEETETAPRALAGMLRDRSWRIFRFPGERWIHPVGAHGGPAGIGAALRDQGPGGFRRGAAGTRRRGLGGDLRPRGVPRSQRRGRRRAVDGFRPGARGLEGQPGSRARPAGAMVPALHGLEAMVHLEDAFYVVPRGEWSVVGATMEHGVLAETDHSGGPGGSPGPAAPALPGLDLSTAVESWAGIRPRTRDRVPPRGQAGTGAVRRVRPLPVGDLHGPAHRCGDRRPPGGRGPGAGCPGPGPVAPPRGLEEE